MSQNLLTAGRKALIRQLETITTGNGYRTNAGANVCRGWFNEVLKTEQLGFPVIVLQKAKGLPPKAGPGAVKLFSGFYVIGAVDVGLDDYDDALEELEHDLIVALMPTEHVLPAWLPRGITGISVGAPECFPPGNGERVASVLIPVHLHTIIQGKYP